MFKTKRKRAIAVVQDYIVALNARDATRMKAMLHSDCRFTDSHGFSVEGFENSCAAVDAFLELDDQFKMHVSTTTMHGNSILMSGYTTARDPRLEGDTLWSAQVKDGKLLSWQSFGDMDSPAITHMIALENAGKRA